VMRRGVEPASLYQARQRCCDTLYLDNGGDSGTGYLMMTLSFTLQLRGPFDVFVRTGLSPGPRSLVRLIDAYSSSSQLLARFIVD
jgi:hypothetical protein